MPKIRFGKKYFLSCYDYKSEGVYLGKIRKRDIKNRHFFMVWHSFMNAGEEPVIISCNKFKIKKEGNKLETISSKMYFPKLSKNEKEYLTDLAKKYW